MSMPVRRQPKNHKLFRLAFVFCHVCSLIVLRQSVDRIFVVSIRGLTYSYDAPSPIANVAPLALLSALGATLQASPHSLLFCQRLVKILRTIGPTTINHQPTTRNRQSGSLDDECQTPPRKTSTYLRGRRFPGNSPSIGHCLLNFSQMSFNLTHWPRRSHSIRSQASPRSLYMASLFQTRHPYHTPLTTVTWLLYPATLTHTTAEPNPFQGPHAHKPPLQT